MKVIVNVKGLFANGRTYAEGVPLEPDDVLRRLADTGAKRNGVVAVTYIDAPQHAEAPAPSEPVKPESVKKNDIPAAKEKTTPPVKKDNRRKDKSQKVDTIIKPSHLTNKQIINELHSVHGVDSPDNMKRPELIKLLVATRINTFKQ